MMEETDPHLTFHPQGEPLEGATVMRNRWWVVHPDKGLVVFRDSPQCNSQKAAALMIRRKLYPWAEVQFLEVAIVNVGPRG